MVIRVTYTVSKVQPVDWGALHCDEDSELKALQNRLEERAEVNHYINQIRSAGEEARKLYSIKSLLENSDKKHLVEYFLPDVVEIAEEYHDKQTGSNLMELVGEGITALAEYIHNSSLRHTTTIRAHTRDAIEKGIRNYLLSEEANRLTTEYDTDGLASSGVDSIQSLQDSLDKKVLNEELNRLLESLTPTQRKRLEMRYRLGEYQEPGENDLALFTKIAEREGVTSYSVRQAISQGIKKLQTPTRHYTLAKIVEAIYGRVCENPPLLTPKEDLGNLEAMLETVKRDLRMSPDKFMHHHGLSRQAFADFLTSIYPQLSEKTTLRLVSLSEEERNKLDFREIEHIEECKDINSIKRTVAHLERRKQELDRNTEIDLQDRLRELYLPLFLSDKDKCVAILQEEAQQSETPKLRDLFLYTANYFSTVQNLTVEGICTSLDNFQKVDVEILCSRPTYIVASEMGTGKSLEAIAYAVRQGLQNILIVSTKSGAFSTWPHELEKHLVSPNIVVLDGQTLRNSIPVQNSNGRTWSITTYSTATRNIVQLKKANFDLVILDECHKVNNQNTAQSRSLLSLDPLHKLAVSGSLFKNYRTELFPILNWLYPEDFPDRDDFERTYCKNDRGLYKLQFELKRRMICRLKDEVLDLPPVQHSTESVAMEGNMLEEYTAIEQDFIRWYEETVGSVHGNFASQAVLTKLHKLRLKAIEPKIPLIDELVKEGVNAGDKTVLYTTYISAAEEFTRRYEGYGVCSLDGRTPNTERAKIIKQFEDDPEKRVFVVTAAGGESIDLTPARRIIYANKPLTYADAKQMLDRLNRRGQQNTVQAYHLVTLGSIDERIQKLIERKKKEYDMVIHDSKEFVNWFEESESRNVRELIEGMVSSLEVATV